MLDDELADDDFDVVELEDEGVDEPVEELLDDLLELLEGLFPEELEPPDRSSRRESSPDRPRRSRPPIAPVTSTVAAIIATKALASFIAALTIRARSAARILSSGLLIKADVTTAQIQAAASNRCDHQITKFACHTRFNPEYFREFRSVRGRLF